MTSAAVPLPAPDNHLDRLDEALRVIKKKVRSGELAGADTPTKGFQPGRVRKTRETLAQITKEARKEQVLLAPDHGPPAATPCPGCGTTHLLEDDCMHGKH